MTQENLHAPDTPGELWLQQPIFFLMAYELRMVLKCLNDGK